MNNTQNNTEATPSLKNLTDEERSKVVNAYIAQCAQDPEKMAEMVRVINKIAAKETKKRIVVKTITYVAIGAALLAAGYFARRVIPANVVPVDPAV